MRIRSGPVLLAICLFLGPSAVVALPEVASAEWTEESRPCDMAKGAVLPQPVLWFEVGISVPAPEGYFTDGVAPLLAPPASDFTATVDWEDGTTSPATVEALSVGDCFGVSAPSHAYESTGTYPFSYTVLDLKTGLDHKLAAVEHREFHIYSKTPQLVGGPSSRAIDAVVGAPWSGVVAEFSYTIPSDPPLPYQAQIEWGDGEAPTTATISTQGSEHTFTVSGSHTYARPLNGTIKVLLSLDGWGWNASEQIGAWVTGSVDVTRQLRFRGQPLLAVIARRSKAPLYELVFRLNRPLPQTSSGYVGAMIEANGQTNPVRQLTAHGTSACYVARASGIGKRKLKPGARYPFTLAVDAGTVTRDSDRASLRQFVSLSRMRSVASRSLGCA